MLRPEDQTLPLELPAPRRGAHRYDGSGNPLRMRQANGCVQECLDSCGHPWRIPHVLDDSIERPSDQHRNGHVPRSTIADTSARTSGRTDALRLMHTARPAPPHAPGPNGLASWYVPARADGFGDRLL